ncbi:MAG: hypothetical protein FWB98_03260 [Defluviitaleaceae bacterium]|nr:hypothetical protein [Defluviitaleaceae bacterium]
MLLKITDILITETGGNAVCFHCEYYGTSHQYHAKRKTCINPTSPWHGCKRGSLMKCAEFTPRKDGKRGGIPTAWHKQSL